MKGVSDVFVENQRRPGSRSPSFFITLLGVLSPRWLSFLGKGEEAFGCF